MKNKGAVVGLVIIIAALAFSAVAFKGNLVNIVPFAEAIKATDSDVQVMGTPIVGSLVYDSAAHTQCFAMREAATSQVLSVTYKGPKPEDMDSAFSKAVAINATGTYDPAQKVFVADKLLIKCPSKYVNGQTTDRSYGG